MNIRQALFAVPLLVAALSSPAVFAVDESDAVKKARMSERSSVGQ